MHKKAFQLIVDNTSGVLSRISGLFSRRGYNIESITAGVTADPRFTRITIVASGDDEILDQIEKLIVSQFRIAHQRGDLRVLRNGTNRLQRLEHLRHFISAGLTFLKGLHEARGVGARNRRKFSHNQSFAFNCSSN